MIIYKATNTINGKCYIGMTTRTLKERIQDHHKGATHQNTNKSRFQYAVLKYGRDQFTWEVLYTAQCMAELIEKEKEYISLYNATDRNTGYNVASGGFRNNNFLGLSDETKEQIRQKISVSASQQYANLSEEAKEAGRRRMSSTARKFWAEISEEDYRRRQEVSRANAIGRLVSDETRCKISKARQGTTLPVETITQMSIDRDNIPPGYTCQPKKVNDNIQQPKKSESKQGSLNPMYGKCGKDNTQSISIICTNLKTKEEQLIIGIQEAGRVLGIPASMICRCLKKHHGRRSTYGYSFRYVEPSEEGSSK